MSKDQPDHNGCVCDYVLTGGQKTSRARRVATYVYTHYALFQNGTDHVSKNIGLSCEESTGKECTAVTTDNKTTKLLNLEDTA